MFLGAFSCDESHVDRNLVYSECFAHKLKDVKMKIRCGVHHMNKIVRQLTYILGRCIFRSRPTLAHSLMTMQHPSFIEVGSALLIVMIV